MLDTRPMRVRVWQTADAFNTRYTSWELHHDEFGEDGAGPHVHLLDDGPFRWLLSREADIGW